jgi:ribosomal protein L37AE/L43A
MWGSAHFGTQLGLNLRDRVKKYVETKDQKKNCSSHAIDSLLPNSNACTCNKTGFETVCTLDIVNK